MADWPLAGGDGQQITSSTITSGTYGVTVTASGSTNTKGSWVQMHAGVPYDVSGVYVQIVSCSAAVGYSLDVGIGAGGSETVRIPDVVWASSRANYGGPYLYFPVSIPKGSRVACRMQSTGASATAIVSLLFVAAGFANGPSFSRVTAYGVQTSGTSIPTTIDPGGSANTKGSWVQLVAACNRIRALNMHVSLSNAATASTLWTIDVGIGATPQIVLPDLALRCELTYDEVTQQAHGPFPISIPAGVALKVRCKSSITDATDRLIRVALYGVD